MFSQLLYSHRRRRAMSQEDLARRAGLTARSIRNLEGGSVRTPRPGTVQRLADGLALDGEDRERFESAAVATYLGEGESGPRAARSRPRFVVTEGVVSTPGGGVTVRWTRNLTADAPGNEFCVTIRGFTASHAASRPAELLRAVLDALGAHAQDLPTDQGTGAGPATGADGAVPAASVGAGLAAAGPPVSRRASGPAPSPGAAGLAGAGLAGAGLAAAGPPVSRPVQMRPASVGAALMPADPLSGSLKLCP